MKCARCGRTIRNSVLLSGSAYGSTCARIVFGAKVRRTRKRAQADPNQQALPLEVQA